MSLYNENQRNQKLTALKYLNKYNKRITRLDNKINSLNDYSVLEKAIRKVNSPELKDMLREEIQNKKSKVYDQTPHIEVILNQGTDFIIPVTKSNIKNSNSFSYTLYSYFQNTHRSESKFGNYIVVKSSEREAYNLAKNISKLYNLKNVAVTGGFNFEYSPFPRNGHARSISSKKITPLSENEKKRIRKLYSKGVIDSHKIKEKLGLDCRIMQVAGVIAGCSRNK